MQNQLLRGTVNTLASPIAPGIEPFKVVESTALKVLTFLIILFLFLFSDLYYEDIGRPFDYAALILILLILGLFPGYSPSQLRANAFILFFMTLPWCLAGFWNESALAAIAFLIGSGYVLPLTFTVLGAVRGAVLQQSIFLTILIGLTVFYLQFGFFVTTGIFIDIPGLVGSIESRGLNEALGYFRPSGVFQEPNAYCTVMFCLGALHAVTGRRRWWLEALLIFSFFLSRSLWGFGAAAVLVGILYGWRYMALGLIGAAVITAMYNLIFGIDIEGLVASSTTMLRIFNIFNDASAQARFGQMSNFEMGTVLLIGNGIDTANFQDFGANGVAFMLYCFGIVGAFVILIIYKISFKMRNRTIISVITLLTTYPPFSYMYFWFWLAAMIFFEFYEIRKNKNI